uniref:Inositol-phosphate phosphatase n=1 Tax=Sphaeramia orbicularis TaxID=375764 RepID=A0A673AQQ6_9TELE
PDKDVQECVFRVTVTSQRPLPEHKYVKLKSSAADLVTETDQRVEKFLIMTIRRRFPQHRFIGEESIGAGEHLELTDSPTWIIDPIDGTVNFVHRFPFVAVSIAFTVNKRVNSCASIHLPNSIPRLYTRSYTNFSQL